MACRWYEAAPAGPSVSTSRTRRPGGRRASAVRSGAAQGQGRLCNEGWARPGELALEVDPSRTARLDPSRARPPVLTKPRTQRDRRGANRRGEAPVRTPFTGLVG